MTAFATVFLSNLHLGSHFSFSQKKKNKTSSTIVKTKFDIFQGLECIFTGVKIIFNLNGSLRIYVPPAIKLHQQVRSHMLGNIDALKLLI